MIRKSDMYGVPVTSEHAIHGLQFSGSFHEVDELYEAVLANFEEATELRKYLWTHRLQTERLAALETYVAGLMSKQTPPRIAMYPSVLKDIAEFALPQLVENYHLNKSTLT